MSISNNENKYFEEIYLKHLPRVTNFAYGYLFDMDQAKSVAQEVFIKLWDKRETIDPEKEIGAFLLVITRNMCLNILKRRTIERKYMEYGSYQMQSEINYLSLADSASGSLIEKEIGAQIEIALAKMTDKVRSTFLLSRTNNLKQQEIADLQGVALRTIESRLKTAVDLLKKALKDYLAWIVFFSVDFFA